MERETLFRLLEALSHISVDQYDSPEAMQEAIGELLSGLAIDFPWVTDDPEFMIYFDI